MAIISAFTPRGKSVRLDANSVASVAVQTASDNSGSYAYYVFNQGLNDVWINWGPGQSDDPVAVIPQVGVPATGMGLPARTSQVFTFPPGAKVAAITATGTTTLYITPGEGM